MKLYSPFDLDILPDIPNAPLSSPFTMSTPANKTTKGESLACLNGMNGNNIVNADDFMSVLEARTAGALSKFTPEGAADYIEFLLAGDNVVDAAAKIGVSNTTIFRWKEFIPGFREAVSHARKERTDIKYEISGVALDTVDPEGENHKVVANQLRKAEIVRRFALEEAKLKHSDYMPKQANLNINAEVSPVDLSNYQ